MEPTAELDETQARARHAELEKLLAEVEGLARKVAAVHGLRSPGLVALRDAVAGLAAGWNAQLARESMLPAPAGEPARSAELETLIASAAQVRQLAGEEAPAWACRSMRALYADLTILEQHLAAAVRFERGLVAGPA